RYKPHLQTMQSAILSVNNLQHEVKLLNKERRTVLDIDNITIYEGDQIAIVGNNGAGKTTLMKSLAGIIRPKQGTITMDNIDILKMTVEKLSSHISYIYQNLDELYIQVNIKNVIIYSGD